MELTKQYVEGVFKTLPIGYYLGRDIACSVEENEETWVVNARQSKASEELDEKFECPQFIGKEVTGEKRYYNSHLTRMPYKLW